MANESEDLHAECPRLTNDKAHFHSCHDRWLERMTATPESPEYDIYADQCGGCRFFLHLTDAFKFDWGVCSNPKSPRDGLATFEHDQCREYVACSDGWD